MSYIVHQLDLTSNLPLKLNQIFNNYFAKYTFDILHQKNLGKRNKKEHFLMRSSLHFSENIIHEFNRIQPVFYKQSGSNHN